MRARMIPAVAARPVRLAASRAAAWVQQRSYSIYPSPAVARAFPTAPLLPPLGRYDSFTAAVGNTSLVRLRGPSEATGCEIWGKCEW